MDKAAAAPDAPEPNAASGAANPKPQRVLACLLCQQRKIKCDRRFPCANCTRSRAQCVPASLVPRQRRRRFPERELLDRIRHYEGLLRQHNVNFEPLHPTAVTEHVPPPISKSSPDAGQSEVCSPNQATTLKPRTTNLWHALSQKNLDAEHDDSSDDESEDGFLHDGDDLRGAVIKKAWDNLMDGANGELANEHHLLFGSPASPTKDDLTALHPQQAQIFRLWQIYLDNVDPLFKVTHTPSLQARIVNAISDLTSVSAPLEALMFSIYCVAVLSLSEEQCLAVFGSPKQELLAVYQFACRQALVNCRFLQSRDHDCLAALYLYLVSVKPSTDPRSLSSLLAIAIRIAQRMGYHNESSNAKCNPLEAELRRRLWWSLVIFDNRICEIFNYKTATLAPTWDCRTPLNLNDFELRAETKSSPPVSERPTEALFAVVRSELSDFVRHSAFHLDFIDPLLTTFAQAKNAAGRTSPSGRRDLPELQRAVEEMFRLCEPENPLHFMTMWTARGYLAKIQLLEHCWRRSTSSAPQPDSPHDPVVSYARTLLESDTKLMSSPLMEGFLWHIQTFYFPFLGYAYILQRLKKRPGDDQAELAWESMSDNYEARNLDSGDFIHHPFFTIFARMVVAAWEAREAMLVQYGISREVPRIVVRIKDKIARMRSDFAEQLGVGARTAVNPDESVAPNTRPLNLGGTAAGAQCFTAPTPSFPGYPGMQCDGMMALDTDSLWPTMGLGFMPNQGW
ncbi:hypothetical protein C8A03DRAFT_18518 [Achaetomium macrosporum]|uniref:Zn(2)-C6 fungal-type domain-containing protein n=1 Tax=Achaetomium macrosporum TaxID=79813 RepID=A0AAN7H4K9_9PEZI|nr:hypothetical protein C8A03DRAFT_18518 [Achaetomium macrosporum]